MNGDKRKNLIYEYKNRMREMGIIYFKCIENGEYFLGISKDLPVAFNGILIRLNGGMYPNKKLQSLWKEYGKEGFEYGILEKLDERELENDYSFKLEEMLLENLKNIQNSNKLWK